jgi:hypothetical protein
MMLPTAMMATLPRILLLISDASPEGDDASELFNGGLSPAFGAEYLDPVGAQGIVLGGLQDLFGKA